MDVVRTRALLVSLLLFFLVIGSLFVFNACGGGTTGGTGTPSGSESVTQQERQAPSNEATNAEISTDVAMPATTGDEAQEKDSKESTSVRIVLNDGAGVSAVPTNSAPTSVGGMSNNPPTPESSEAARSVESTGTSSELQEGTPATGGNLTQPVPTSEREPDSGSQGVPVENEQKEPGEQNVSSQAGGGTVRLRFSKDDFPLNTLPVEPEEKIILITIDDGPGEYTMELLDLLKKENVKVVFFLNGDTVPWYKNVVRREYEEGHTIGTHTYCHRSYYQLEKRASKEELIRTLRRDITRTEENIKAILPDLKIRLLRMPEGYYRKWMEPIIDEFGYICINWTAGFDWLTEPDEKIIAYYKKALRPGGIYLFHDGRYRGKRTIKILSEFIPYARAQGYRIVDPKEIFGN